VKTNLITENKTIRISATDQICTSNSPEAETSYDVHNKIKVRLSAERTDGLFCLDPDNANTILLTATPETGTSTQYEWYRDDVLIATTYPPDNSISMNIEKGANKYSVKASDGICISGGQMEDAQDEITINAAEPVRLVLEPQDTILCEGENITFRASVLNSPDENMQVAWSGDDIPAGTITTGSNPTLSVSPSKTNLVTENKTIRISATDQICTSNSPEAETSYSVHNKIKVQLSAERTDGLFCLDPDNANTILLTATPETGTPTQYEWYKDDLLLLVSEQNEVNLPIEKGVSRYSVKATDGVCISGDQTGDAQDEISVEAQTPIILSLSAEKNTLCEEEELTLTARVTNTIRTDVEINWFVDGATSASHHSLALPSSNPNELISAWAFTPAKTGNQTESGTVRISSPDNICTSGTDNFLTYNVHKKIEIKLEAEGVNEQVCIRNENDKTINLKALVTKGEPSNYIWSDGQYEGQPERTATITPGENHFSVQAVDGVCNTTGTEAVTTMQIDAREPITVDLSVSKGLVCLHESTTLTVTINNSFNTNTRLSWNPSSIAPSSDVSNGSHDYPYTPQEGDTYVTVSAVEVGNNICGSSVSDEVTITARDSVRLRIDASSHTVCQDGNTEITLETEVLSGKPSSITWFDGTVDPMTNKNISHLTITPATSSNYWASATDDICNNIPTVTTDLINVTTSISLDLTVNTENAAFGDTITLTVNSSSEDHGPFNWYRSPEELLLGTTEENTFRYKPTEEGTFGFYVSTGNGYCPNVQSQIVYVSVKDLPLIPSIITPYNHNNKNDVFMGPKNGEPGYKVEIYNRYQQLIFEGKEGWDGTYKGRPADPGTYFYRLFLRNGKAVKGSLEVIKF
jgi:gliding motility-associated-like protein